MYEITEAQKEKLNRVSVNCYFPGEDGKPKRPRLCPLGTLVEQVFKVLNEEEEND